MAVLEEDGPSANIRADRDQAPVTPPRPLVPKEGPPKALDLMAGHNAPWSKALGWCGWSCEPWDIPIDASHDLSDPAKQAEIPAKIDEIDALLWGMDCNSLTRARERPVAGNRHPPPRLR